MAPRRRRPSPATHAAPTQAAATQAAQGRAASSALSAATSEVVAGEAAQRRLVPRRDGELAVALDSSDDDLVPPSDEEEYDAWQEARVARAAREQSGMSSPGAGPSRAPSRTPSTMSMQTARTSSTEPMSFVPLIDDDDDFESLPASGFSGIPESSPQDVRNTLAFQTNLAPSPGTPRRARIKENLASTLSSSPPLPNPPTANGSPDLSGQSRRKVSALPPSTSLAPSPARARSVSRSSGHLSPIRLPQPASPAPLSHALTPSPASVQDGKRDYAVLNGKAALLHVDNLVPLGVEPLAMLFGDNDGVGMLSSGPPSVHDVDADMAQPTASRSPSPDPLAASIQPSPRAISPRPAPSRPPSLPQRSPARGRPAMERPPSPPSSPLSSPGRVQHAPPRPPSPPPVDPALERFRSARTFRTRTALQLQPYTREKQLYEKTLRRGGLVKGRNAVAPSAEVRGDEDDGSDADAVPSELSDDEAATPPDAIVIGGTLEEPVLPWPAKPPRRPVKLSDEDYDTFFFNRGRAAEDEDAADQKELRRIARVRIKAEKEERRQVREAERADRLFEQFVKDKERRARQERKGEHSDEEEEAEGLGRRPAATPARSRARPEKTPARPKTYSKKLAPQSKRTGLDARASRDRSVAGNESSEPDTAIRRRATVRRDPDSSPPLDGADEMSRTSRTPALTLGTSPRDSPRLFASTATPRRRSALASGLSPLDMSPVDHGHLGFDAIDTVNDFDSLPDLPGTGSFFVNDMPAPTGRTRRAPSSSSASSVGSAASDGEVEDRRARIARRMMPAAMLQRLEREAAEKERRKRDDNEKRKRAARNEAPVRPGRAVVRRGAGADDDVALFADSGDESDVSAGLATTSMRASSARPTSARAASSADQPILVSDDESSEAEEDNRPHESLARLQRGDFEGIVAGHGVRPRSTMRPVRQRRLGRRPALGLAKSGPAPRATSPRSPPSPRTLKQTLLDFMPADKPRAATKRKRRDRAARPAIRLDDHVIFAHDDFAFEEESEPDIVVTDVRCKAARPFARSSSTRTIHDRRASPRDEAGPQRALDDGVGKARSWANFDRFPIDFDISPLPSGVYCFAAGVPSGALAQVLGALSTGTGQLPEACEACGIEFRPGMGADELYAVLPIALARLREQVVGFANDQATKPSMRPLAFIGDYHLAGCVDGIDTRVLDAVAQISSDVDEVAIAGQKQDRTGAELVLAFRWEVVSLVAKLHAAQPDNERCRQLIESTSTSLLRGLLSFGFDRTMRPVKRILRGEADEPGINDVSVYLWVAVLHVLGTYDRQTGRKNDETFLACLNTALDQVYRHDQVGPIAAERIWYVAFGLCALSQFGADGVVSADFTPAPRWPLVRRAISLIKVAHSLEAEEHAHHDQLQGRDRYLKTMVARCVRLSSSWRWYFDRTSFSVATRDLGIIFKDRQHRNLPTEPPADFPAFITRFDIALTAAEDSKRESAFELYLRLACVAASDVIGAARALDEARQAERDVQRLLMSIFPLSAVTFTRALPPTPRQLAALVNRYATMVVACYFSPSLLPWLLANSLKWLAFSRADFESRQVCIRGLMYLAVACRHHSVPLDSVVQRLADILATLQAELGAIGKPGNPLAFPTKFEIERTMVLVVTCFRQIILHHSYDTARQREAVYPDPSLLHACWTARVFELDLAKDLPSGIEIVSTIQAFLSERARALPLRARRAREARVSESLTDDYPSLGIEFDIVDLAALGDEGAKEDPVEKQDAAFAQIIKDVISPKIYKLLTDMLPAVDEEDASAQAKADRQALIGKLTKCWSDCTSVVVVEHRLMDWQTFVGPFGAQSWSRLPDEAGRVRVGLQFMLNVARLDPGAFRTYEDDFLALFFQVVVTDRLTIEHEYASALLAMPGALHHPLLAGVADVPGAETGFDRALFMAQRPALLRAVFGNVPGLLASPLTPASMKPFIYRCINLLVSALATNEAAIDATRVIHHQSYRAFARETVRDLQTLAGDYITPFSVPRLRTFIDTA